MFAVTSGVTVKHMQMYFIRNNYHLITWQEVLTSNEPRQANLVLIAYASSEGSGEPAHPRSLARTSAARSYKLIQAVSQEEPSDRKPNH